MPFIVTWGSRLTPSKTAHVAQFTDLMPTFADLAGVQAPANDGISFAPILLGKPQKQQEHDFLYWEYPSAKGWLAVRMGSWKGLVKRVVKGNGKMELYNLEEDPREDNDVAAAHPDIVQQMWEIIQANHEPSPLPVEKFQMNLPEPQLP